MTTCKICKVAGLKWTRARHGTSRLCLRLVEEDSSLHNCVRATRQLGESYFQQIGNREMATKKASKKSAPAASNTRKGGKKGAGVNFRELSAAVRKAKRGKEKAVQLPDGFRVVGRAPNHDFDKHPIIEGERGPAKEVTLNEGTKNEKETRCFVMITEDLGAVTVWESAGLRDLFDDTEDGDYIRIEHTETLAPRKKGQQGMRVFACAVRE